MIDKRYVTLICLDNGEELNLKGFSEKIKEADLLNWVQVGAWPVIKVMEEKFEIAAKFENV